MSTATVANNGDNNSSTAVIEALWLLNCLDLKLRHHKPPANGAEQAAVALTSYVYGKSTTYCLSGTNDSGSSWSYQER
jgi:hypothetical protein